MKESVSGWFKLLAQEEGEFYSVPVPSEEGLKIQLKSTTGVVFIEINQSNNDFFSFLLDLETSFRS